jgi:two-component system nitrogen regulation response regulator NtrX
VEMASGSDAPVLVVGVTGSGRETVARRIHASGSRSDAPFVELPCAAVDAAAAAAALYGVEGEGGRLQLATGGTLFLEDADRLALELQARLASSLRRQARTPPGLRVMASVSSTDEGLDPELRPCVDVIRVAVPELRRRREDIPLLAERFMREISREYGRRAKPLAPDAIAALQAHDWPGNIRELHNLVERLLLLVPGEAVALADLPEALGGDPGPAEDLYREFGSLKEGVRAFERYYVLRVLAGVNGNRQKAASRLGLTSKRLRDLLSRF